MTRHDRTGEEIEWPEVPTHDPRCDGNGWIDRDGDPAVPCRDCKPNTRPEALRRQVFGPYEEMS